MGKWCPRCGSEFVEGWGTCSNCGVELVAERPPPKEEPQKQLEPQPSFLEPGAGRGEDPFISIWEGPTSEGAPMARRLQAAHIPVDLGEALEPGHLRIEVPRSYVDEAYGVLDMPDHMAPVADDAEDDWEPGEPAGWPFGARVFIALVAIGLVVLLILTSR